MCQDRGLPLVELIIERERVERRGGEREENISSVFNKSVLLGCEIMFSKRPLQGISGNQHKGFCKIKVYLKLDKNPLRPCSIYL